MGQSLEKLAHGRTTLTIAHRLTTIKDYDRILVLGAEGIEESGTHDELLAKKGVYYRLWNQLDVYKRQLREHGIQNNSRSCGLCRRKERLQ